MDELWNDLKRPVSEAGKGNQLNTFPELSVAFWRWAIWKLFEAENAPRRGVVTFITNRKFLTGWPYAGLRKMMRERFDRIEIVDLRGDVRRGERADVERDTGVFNIQVGTCIALAVADGTKAEGALAHVLYNDAWADARMSRRAKLDWLTAGADAGLLTDAIAVDRGPLEDMRPRPFQVGNLYDLRKCFEFAGSGIETKRDHIVYGPSRSVLLAQLQSVIFSNDLEKNRLFNSTGMNSAASAQNVGVQQAYIKEVAYRPFDRRQHYAHPNWNDRLRPDLRDVFGNQNFCLFTLPSGVGRGPAAWCYSQVTDRHAFRGSYGGYAFPLFDRRNGPEAHNLSPALLEGLRRTYGAAVAPQDIFDCILCLLSASSYSIRFAEDLEDVFPHVPFPADPTVFARAAALGREIRAVQTFARPPDDAQVPAGFASLADQPRGAVTLGDYAEEALTLGENGTGRVTGLPQRVWNFSVSGYPVLKRWIEGREGLPADLAMLREFADVCGRIAEMIDLCARADTILHEALRDSLGAQILDTAAEPALPDA